MEGTAISLLCTYLLSILMFYSAADTITLNQTIRDGQTIVSARGEFEMGFFCYKANPGKRYFGIWYKQISTGMVIWTANRKSPILDTSGVVRVSSRGIVLSNKSSDSIWTSNSTRSVKNPVAQLLDTGNLVFRDKIEQQNFAWQSFGHPKDHFLPRMKYQYTLTNPMNMEFYYVQWKSDDDPTPDDYIHWIDENSYPHLYMWKNSAPRKNSGPWYGSRFTDFYIAKSNSESSFTRLTLVPFGVSTRFIWIREKHDWEQYHSLEGNMCDIFGICGTNGVCDLNKSPRCECMEGFEPKNPDDWAQENWSAGCSRKVQLKCENKDGFSKHTGVQLPNTRWSWYNTSMSLVECEDKCLEDCNCTAYSNADISSGGSGCQLWFGGLTDMQRRNPFSQVPRSRELMPGYPYLRMAASGQDLYVRMAASESTHNTEDIRKLRVKKHLHIIKLVLVLVIVPVMISLLLLYGYKTKRFNRTGKRKTLAAQDLDLPLFSFRQITKATDNFSNNRQLGKGGFGPVYKGILEDGQEIAVKRLSKDSRQGVDEFMNEVSCIAKLQHRNLVMLLGCCIEEGERILIYEYLPNKSLDHYIFDKNMSQSLNWPKRYNIIVGIARGLLYLHQDSRLRIIHRDLKAGNILLDGEMNPKISDFGLARTLGESEAPASTTRLVGTPGYMSPEYVNNRLFSVKSDVYSFGVSLLEIVAGKRNRGFIHPDHDLLLTGHMWKSYNEGNLLELVDSDLESSNQHEVFRVIQIGLLCVQEYPEDRPDMSSTIMMLTRDDALPIPKEPGFFLEKSNRPETGSSRKTFTLNTMGVSSFAPR